MLKSLWMNVNRMALNERQEVLGKAILVKMPIQ
jgi:hypothetical protein